MLQDYLVENVGDNLEVEPEDYVKLRAVRDTAGVRLILKKCLAAVLEIEGALFADRDVPLSDARKERLIGARNAYYSIAGLIANPPVEESENE